MPHANECGVCGEPMIVGGEVFTLGAREQVHLACYETIRDNDQLWLFEALVRRIEALEARVEKLTRSAAIYR